MRIPPELAKYGLEEIRQPKRRRLVLVGDGETFTGKSDFVLRTGPRPLLYVNLDRNSEGLEERYEGDDILIKTVRMGEMIDQEKDRKLYESMYEMVMTSIRKSLFRTVAIDTMDAWYELLRRAMFGKLEQVPQYLYTKTNSHMLSLFSAAKDQRVNFYAAHKLGDEYKESWDAKGMKKVSVKTGRRKRKGWGDAEYQAQMHVRFRRNPEVSGVGRFECEILKCTTNESAEGEVLTGADITWANLGMLAFPATMETPEVWE